MSPNALGYVFILHAYSITRFIRIFSKYLDTTIYTAI